MSLHLINKLTDNTLLEIKEQADGIFLYHIFSNGRVNGDTWHQTLEDAKHQANFQFGNFLTKWENIQPVP